MRLRNIPGATPLTPEDNYWAKSSLYRPSLQIQKFLKCEHWKSRDNKILKCIENIRLKKEEVDWWTSPTRITKKEEFACSYVAIHLNKFCRHVTKLSQIRNKTSDISLHFLSRILNVMFVCDVLKNQEKTKMPKRDYTYGWRNPSESSSSSLISILACVRETCTRRDFESSTHIKSYKNNNTNKKRK